MRSIFNICLESKLSEYIDESKSPLTFLLLTKVSKTAVDISNERMD